MGRSRAYQVLTENTFIGGLAGEDAANHPDNTCLETARRRVPNHPSERRNCARLEPVFEFSATLPVDDVRVDPDARFDPETCQLECANAPCAVFP